MEDEWKVVKKASNIPTSVITPLVSLRKIDISFNTHFVKHAELKKYTYVTLYASPVSYKVGFKFHNDPKDPNGNKLMDGRMVAAGRLYKENPWLKAVTKLEDDNYKRFEVKKNSDGFWEIQISPAFEKVVKSTLDIHSDIKGIYQYRRKGEIVYIGRGNIRSRVSSPEREAWEYDTIEYSIIEDDTDQAHWESYWLNKHEQEYARLPLYNRLGGKKIK